MKHRIGRRSQVLAVSVVACFLAAACTDAASGDSSDGSDSKSRAEPGLVNMPDDDPDPTSGGTLDVSLYSPPPSLDPAKAYGTIATSGIPMAAVYGVLMRYDPDSGDYEPKLAKSLSHNDDFTSWTLKLRDDVEFSDGNPLDADAVVANLKRIGEEDETTVAPIVSEVIDDYETPDAHTVKFDLSKSWSRFPFVLATNGGMVPSPKAVKERGDDFERKPVGAGPFTVKSFNPDGEIQLVRNDDYWDGDVPLDKVHFTHIAGGEATQDRFDSGDVQMGTVLDAETINDMVQDDVPGYVVYNHAGGWVPNQNKGKPAADPRLRKAIAYAIDVDQLNDRASSGNAPFHRGIFPESSPWNPDTDGVSHDPDKARKLVKEVKKDTDWDGSFNALAVQKQPAAWQEAIALKGQLESVGFDVKLDGLQDINQLTRRVFVKQDYDLAYWVVTAWDSAPWPALQSNLYSKSERNAYGYANDDFDKLLDKMRSAPTDKKRSKVVEQMQQLWNDDQPMILDKSSDNYAFWSNDVHGVQPTSKGVVLLDDAFMD